MADVRDYLAASYDTDRALEAVRISAEQGSLAHTEGTILLAAAVLTCAIREFGTRLDYVLRDIEQRRP